MLKTPNNTRTNEPEDPKDEDSLRIKRKFRDSDNIISSNNNTTTAILNDVRLQKYQRPILKTSVNLMQMFNTLVSIKPGEPLSQATLMSLKANTTDALAILSYANQNILQTRKDDIMPSLSKEFRHLRNNVPKDSKLLFGDDINQHIMSTSKTSKSVVKYQSPSRHDEKYSRPSKSYNYYQNQPKNFKSFPKTSSSPFGKKNKGQYYPKKY